MGIKEKYQVQSINKELTYDWLLNVHYAGRIPSIMFSFGLFDNKILRGICVYGMPAVNMNYGKCIFNDLSINTYELTRLVIKENLGKNVLSYFIAETFKYFEKPTCLVSFADPNNGHHGYIYQATNWIYTGLSLKGGKDKQWIFNKREYHGKTITVKRCKELGFNYDNNKTLKQNWIENGGFVEENELQKYRYIYLIGNKTQKKQMKQKLKYDILSYPKGNNKRYEINYNPVIQGSLF